MLNSAQLIRTLIPVLIPVIILQLIVMIAALRDLIRREHVTGGNKFIWGVVIVLFQFLGPLAYFIFGRKED
jgi:hypothetical protein